MMNEKTMTVESILQRKIASILSMGDQGRVMGAYREAVKELREHNMSRFGGKTADRFWYDELAKIPPEEIRKRTQQDFSAMDETMGFEYKPVRDAANTLTQRNGVAPDALDHSLSDFEVSIYVVKKPSSWACDRTGVQVLHKPTGLFERSHEERSQHKNKEIAYQALLVRLPAVSPVPDALDHSLTEQGSWTKRWLEAK